MVKKIQINFSNKWLYTFIAVGVLILLGVGVYAYGGSSPRIMGHSVSEIAPPPGCTSGQVLQWDGNSWVCAVVSGGSGTTVVQSKPQCPIKSIGISTVDINNNLVKGIASYDNCIRENGFLELSNPNVKKGDNEYSIVVNLDIGETYKGDHCESFCRLFGFKNGECTDQITQTPTYVITNPSVQSACQTQAYDINQPIQNGNYDKYFIKTGWRYYCKECEKCKCYI